MLCAHAYVYVLFEGVCFKLTPSWLPARLKWGWELRLLRHFLCIRWKSGPNSARLVFMRRHHERNK